MEIEKIKRAMDSLDVAIVAVKAIGENKKTNSHVGKLMAIQSDYAAIIAKDEYLSNAPNKRRKKQE